MSFQDDLKERYGGPCIYIAGAYSGEDYNAIDKNIAAAREASSFFARNDVNYMCPHQHSQHMEAVVPEVTYEFWIELDLHLMVYCCNAIYMVPGWEKSSGAAREHGLAEMMGWPIFYLLKDALAWAEQQKAVA